MGKKLQTPERQCLRLTAVQGAEGDLCPEKPALQMHSVKSAPEKNNTMTAVKRQCNNSSATRRSRGAEQGHK